METRGTGISKTTVSLRGRDKFFHRAQTYHEARESPLKPNVLQSGTINFVLSTVIDFKVEGMGCSSSSRSRAGSVNVCSICTSCFPSATVKRASSKDATRFDPYCGVGVVKPFRSDWQRKSCVCILKSSTKMKTWKTGSRRSLEENRRVRRVAAKAWSSLFCARHGRCDRAQACRIRKVAPQQWRSLCGELASSRWALRHWRPLRTEGRRGRCSPPPARSLAFIVSPFLTFCWTDLGFFFSILIFPIDICLV